MPGLAAIAGYTGSDPVESKLAPLTDAMRHRPWYTHRSASVPGAAFASVEVDDAPTFANDDTLTLCVHGDIYDLDSKVPLPDALLTAYRDQGVEALCGLNGLYVVTIWDEDAETLTVVNDRYGMARLYYWLGPDGIRIASECKAIVADPAYPKAVDERGLVDFLTLTFCAGERTLFKDIKILPPATLMTCRQGHIELSRYWDYSFHEPGGPEPTLDEHIHAFTERLRASVRKRTVPRMAMQITGGLDSRVIMGVLSECADPDEVFPVTIGHAHSQDVRFGRRIAHRAGFNHSFVPVDDAFLPNFAEEGAYRADGMISTHNMWGLAQDNFLDQNELRAIMTGAVGGAIAGAGLPNALTDETDEAKAFDYLFGWYYCGTFSDDSLAALLPKATRKNTNGCTRDYFRERWLAANTDNLLSRCEYLDMTERERRFIGSHMDLFGVQCRVIDPLLDNDLVDYAFHMPPQLRLGKQFSAQVTSAMWPHLAKVPKNGRGLPLNPTPLEDKAYRAFKRFYHKILPKLALGQFGDHDYSATVHYNDWIRAGSRSFVEDTVLRGGYLEGLLNMDAVRKTIADHMSARTNAYSQVCALLSLALWRKRFFG
jgi:asparagine synthase (glutamine-hydrolysing)